MEARELYDKLGELIRRHGPRTEVLIIPTDDTMDSTDLWDLDISYGEGIGEDGILAIEPTVELSDDYR